MQGRAKELYGSIQPKVCADDMYILLSLPCLPFTLPGRGYSLVDPGLSYPDLPASAYVMQCDYNGVLAACERVVIVKCQDYRVRLSWFHSRGVTFNSQMILRNHLTSLSMPL